MKTAKDIINAVVLSVKEFFGIKPKTREQSIKKEMIKHQKLINIEERSGRLYIVYYSSAECKKHSFMELNPDMTIKEAIKMLTAARDAAVSYNIL